MAALYYVGDRDGLHHHVLGVPTRDLEREDLARLADQWDMEPMEVRTRLLATVAYQARSLAEPVVDPAAAPAPKLDVEHPSRPAHHAPAARKE